MITRQAYVYYMNDLYSRYDGSARRLLATGNKSMTKSEFLIGMNSDI